AACSRGITPPPVGARAGVGAACTGTRDCRIGLACTAGTCQPDGQGQEGSACELTDSCGPNLFCSPQKVCTNSGTGTLGTACTTSADCQKDLVCALSGIFLTCATPGTVDVGGACTQTTDCLAGLGCQGGVCKAGVDPITLVPFTPQCPTETSPPF